MATYSNIGIKLITTGDESGTWGTSTNTNFSDVLDEAIAGAVTYNISSDADFTLTVSDGTSSDARHAVIKFTSTTLSATRTCTFAPNDLQKTWVVINATTGGQSLTFKQGSAGATVTVPNGESAIIYSDGGGASAGAITRVLDSFTNTKITTGTLNATTLDLTNLEVTNIKAKDGTAAASIADSTGIVSLSANPILSGGTANGVLYLNASKVATSGTALTFDGSTLTNTGNSTGTVANTIVNTDAAGSSITDERIVFAMGGSLGFGITGWANAGIVEAASTGGLYLGAFNGPINFASGASARNINMTLTASGNLGIGTTSPTYKLDVDRGASNGVVARFGRSSGQFAHIYADTASVYFGSDNGANTAWQFNESSDYLAAWTAGSERLRIDSSGNLGLGVTPATWFSGSKAIQFGAFGSIEGRTSAVRTVYATNSYLNASGNNTYIGTGAATAYIQDAGTHAWSYAASGTAGNAITFTQAMTLDADGELGIGVTSPTSRLDVAGPASAGLTNIVKLRTGSGNSTGLEIKGNYSTEDWLINNFYSGYIAFGTNDTERARITSDGQLLLGTTSTTPITTFSGSAKGLTVQSALATIALVDSDNTTDFISWLANSGGTLYLYNKHSTSPLVFGTNNAERARITSGGNLLVGTTTDVSGLTGVISDVSGNVRAIPQSGSDKTTSYTLVKSDVGKFIGVGSGGSITVPDATFATGDVVSIFNNTTGNVTLTMTITTAYIGGTNTDKATITLATRGVATILFISGTVCVVNGNVS